MNLLAFTQSAMKRDKYELGVTDCFRIVMDYAKQVEGIDLPTEYNQMTVETYGSFYEQDSEQTIKVACEYLSKYLFEVPPFRRVAGDILLAQYGDKLFFGIDGGNGNMITVFATKGIRVVKMRHFKIVKVFKWRHQ